VDQYGQNLGTGVGGFNHYIAAIYWSMTTTTTVGYGDILPVTDTERLFVTFVMLVVIGFFGYVVGEMTTVFVDAASNGEMLQQRLKEVRSWAQSRRLSDALLKRLKVYVTAEFEQVGEFNETELLKTMYPSLRIDLMHHILGDCIYKVALPPSFLAFIVFVVVLFFLLSSYALESSTFAHHSMLCCSKTHHPVVLACFVSHPPSTAFRSSSLCSVTAPS
jgi:hypothetical protein